MPPPGSGWDVHSGWEQRWTCQQLCVGKNSLFPATKDCGWTLMVWRCGRDCRSSERGGQLPSCHAASKG